jgi:hypothetical protein
MTRLFHRDSTQRPTALTRGVGRFPSAAAGVCCVSSESGVCDACVAAAGSSSGSTGSGETWKGTFTATAAGAIVCQGGTEPTYNESGSLTFTVPAPGLEFALGNNDTGHFTGTYANIETAKPGEGAHCPPSPVVTSTTTAAMPVAVNQVSSQLRVVGTTVLIPAHFQYASSQDAIDGTELVLRPQSLGEASSNGTWSAKGRDASQVSVTGQFSLQRQ